VLGAEARRRREDHHVGAAVDRLAVGVEADVLVLLGHLEPARDVLGEGPVALVEPVAEGVGHRHQLHRALGRQCLSGGAGAAAAAADQRDGDGAIPEPGVGGAGVRPRRR
jgi:hypothetical protein